MFLPFYTLILVITSDLNESDKNVEGGKNRDEIFTLGGEFCENAQSDFRIKACYWLTVVLASFPRERFSKV